MNENNNEEKYTIDQVIEHSFDFSEYSEEEKREVIAETSSMIMEASLIRALTDASEEVQGKFEEVLQGEPSEEVMGQFIETHLPNFQEVVLSELDTFLNSEDADALRGNKEEA